jgi:hypothetical protein
MLQPNRCEDIRSFDIADFFYEENPKLNKNLSEPIGDNKHWQLLLMQYYDHAYNRAVKGFKGIDPSKMSLESFEKAMDKQLLLYQEHLNIPKIKDLDR